MSSSELPPPHSETLRRAELAESRCEALVAELERVRSFWRSALISIVVVAGLAILMLGVVAFNAVDG